MTKRLAIFLLLGFFSNMMFAQSQNKENVVSVAQFGLDPDKGDDASSILREAIDLCKKKHAKKLIFPKGRYDFYPDQAVEKLMFISNNTSGLKRVAMIIEDMKNFEIDGQGSTFIFHGYICPFIIENSQKILLNNFSIDFARTFDSEGTILAVQKDQLDVSFSEKYPYKIENGLLIFTDGKKTEYPYGNFLEFDPVKKETAFMVNDYYTGPSIRVEEIGPRQVRVHLPNAKGTPGNTMVFAPSHRLCPAITISKSQNVTVDAVNIFHSGGMGIISQMSKNISINRVKVTTTPDSKRVVSCTADATHFSNCSGKVSVTNCLFENQMDDATNVHGLYMRIEKIISPDAVLAHLVHYEQAGVDFITKGQKVELVNPASMRTYSELMVKSVKRYNDEYSQIEFKHNMPSEVKVKDVVGLTTFPEVLFKNNVVRNNRARGLLLGSRKNIMVDGNTFHTPGAAIMTGGDAEYWFEQGGVSNLVIRNNKFENCNYGVWGNSVIQISAGSDDKSNSPRFNRNVTIENNFFRVFDPRILDVSSVDSLIFKNNKIEESTDYPAQNEGSKPFKIINSTNVKIDAEPFVYENPIDFSYPYFNGEKEVSKTELRDPAIIRDGDTYYLVYTHFPFTHHTSRDSSKIDYNSSPGIRLYSSKDLKKWKFEKWLVKSSELPENCPYKNRFWAPEIRKMNNKFYLIFYADNWIKDEYNCDGKMGYVAFVGVSDKVDGPYEHISWLKGAGCDSHLFGDENGKTYIVMPFSNEYIQEVDLSGIENGDIKLIGERKMIVARDNSDVGKKSSPDYMEAPWMIKRNGKYILFTGSPYKESKDGNEDLAPGYWVGAAIANNIWGPYKKLPQVFLGGHIAVFTGPDDKEWFSYRGESGGVSQGKLCIDPIQFNEDGTVPLFYPTTGLVKVEK